MNGKIAGAIVGAILVAAVFGIAHLWRRNANKKGTYAQMVQRSK